MATKTFKAFLVDLGREGILTGRDASAIRQATADYEAYVRDEEAKDNATTAWKRQTARFDEAFIAITKAHGAAHTRIFPGAAAVTWAEVKPLRQQVNALRRALGLNEEVEELPADTPPA